MDHPGLDFGSSGEVRIVSWNAFRVRFSRVLALRVATGFRASDNVRTTKHNIRTESTCMSACLCETPRPTKKTSPTSFAAHFARLLHAMKLFDEDTGQDMLQPIFQYVSLQLFCHTRTDYQRRKFCSVCPTNTFDLKFFLSSTSSSPGFICP